MATIHHISSGKLDGSVYTNGWPEFSAVICKYKGAFSQWVCMLTKYVNCIAMQASSIQFIVKSITYFPMHMHMHALYCYLTTWTLFYVCTWPNFNNNMLFVFCVNNMQFFCCYTSRSEDLLNLLAGTKLIFSKDKNIVLGMTLIAAANY